ncbi:MAG: helix-turn-helix domain-containing protein [Candidatus Zixiibacteriota bacterium]
MNTIGDHTKRARLDRGLFQKQVAQEIGVDPFTILNWETGATKPKFRFLPAIIRFLGYNPFPIQLDSPLSVRIKARRHELGLSLKQLAKILNLNECTIRKVEAGKSKRPARDTLQKVANFIQSFW